MSHWTWAGASCLGTSHERLGQRRQDAFFCNVVGPSSEVIVTAVSDGAGSATHGGQGASLLCRVLSNKIRNHFRTNATLPSEQDVEDWVSSARAAMVRAAEARSLRLRDFAATLVFVVSNAETTMVAHIGDGCAVVKETTYGEWVAPTWPDQGEYASMTYFITDDEPIRLRVHRYDDPISALAVFTDGLERLALVFAEQRPFPPFFESMIRPVEDSTIEGRDRGLSAKLAAFLSGESINSRTDDDKTLVLAVRK